jgi:ketosteroid isomerase-like protein
MRQTFFALSFLLVSISFSIACQTQPATTSDTRAADEAALKKLDDEWSKAAGAKEVDKTVSYYADDASVMPPNSSALTDKASIHAMWKAMLGAPGFSGGWKPTKVEVARSGDLAYVSGTYEFNETDANGKPMTDKGKYLEVWKKQSDGNWKCVADIFNTNLPAPLPPTQTKSATAAK